MKVINNSNRRSNQPLFKWYYKLIYWLLKQENQKVTRLSSIFFLLKFGTSTITKKHKKLKHITHTHIHTQYKMEIASKYYNRAYF